MRLILPVYAFAERLSYLSANYARTIAYYQLARIRSRGIAAWIKAIIGPGVSSPLRNSRAFHSYIIIPLSFRYNEARAKKSKNAAIKRTTPTSEILDKKIPEARYLLTAVWDECKMASFFILTALLILVFN